MTVGPERQQSKCDPERSSGSIGLPQRYAGTGMKLLQLVPTQHTFDNRNH